MTGEARAQSPSGSPFQPSLTDPRHVAALHRARSEPADNAGDDRAAIRRGRDRLRLHRRARQEKEDQEKVRRAASASAATAAVARSAAGGDGHGGAPQIKVRATYADVYKPPDAPVRRPLCRCSDPYEPLGVRVGSFLLKPSIEIDARLRQQSRRTSRTASRRASPRWRRAACRSRDWDAPRIPRRPARQLLRIRQGFFAERVRWSTARPSRASMCRATPRSTSRTGCSCRPIIPAARTCRLASPSCRPTWPTARPLGVTQSINHLELTAKASVDQTKYQNTELIDGEKSSNQDRDYTQYGGARARRLRGVPGREAVRRGRRRHPQARSAIRPRRLSARLDGADAQGRHHLRDHQQAHRREFRSAT